MIDPQVLLRKIARLPGIRHYRQRRYRQAFFQAGKSWPRFYGLFETRDAAQAAAGEAPRIGYDHLEVADVSLEAMSTIWTSDYPMIYWLSKILDPMGSLFDLGGHVGTKYRAWRSYLDLDEAFRWQVCDLPSIVDRGRALSTDLPQLSFTTQHRDLEGHRTMLVSGVLQYADFDLEAILRKHGRGVENLLVNKLPTHASDDAFTLENLHHSVVPYRVFDEVRFLGGLDALGYVVANRWDVPESSVRVPFTTLGTTVHRGYFFRRKDGYDSQT